MAVAKVLISAIIFCSLCFLNSNASVGWTQPIGADPRKNFNAESWEVYGAGAYLLAGSEIVKINP